MAASGTDILVGGGAAGSLLLLFGFAALGGVVGESMGPESRANPLRPAVRSRPPPPGGVSYIWWRPIGLVWPAESVDMRYRVCRQAPERSPWGDTQAGNDG